MKNLIKVFIDTNVWFSGFYQSANAEKIIKAHVNKKFKAVICQQVLDELVRNIQVKIPAAIKPLKVFLEAAPPLVIKDPTRISNKIRLWVNPKDRVILQAAVDSRMQFLITGNLKHFPAKKIQRQFKLKILSPSQAVKLFLL